MPDEKDVWIGRTYADAPDVDTVVYVTGRGSAPGRLVNCEVVAAHGYDLVAAAVGKAARSRRSGTMTMSTKNMTKSAAFNLPNQLTVDAAGLSIVLFVLMTAKLYMVGLVVFLVAASTDWVDGYLARRYGMVTTLGRILDPFADKIIVCGSLIFLARHSRAACLGHAGLDGGLIVGRELLVTALRSFLEQQGADFSAAMSGKLKMVPNAWRRHALFYLSYEPDTVPVAIEYLLIASVWSAVLLTIYSGLIYIRAAVNMLNT